jgi:hypothetical protein
MDSPFVLNHDILCIVSAWIHLLKEQATSCTDTVGEVIGNLQHLIFKERWTVLNCTGIRGIT